MPHRTLDLIEQTAPVAESTANDAARWPVRG
jgi:hypothetical protein